MKNGKLIALLAVLLVLPAMAKAWTVGSILANTVNLIGTIFGVAAVVYFLWYGGMFLMARGDPAKTAEARKGALWGVVGVIIGLMSYGIVQVISVTFGI